MSILYITALDGIHVLVPAFLPSPLAIMEKPLKVRLAKTWKLTTKEQLDTINTC